MTRACAHLEGVKDTTPELGIKGAGERWVCPAFPDGIPEDINNGENLHTTPDPRQEDGTEEIVYQPAAG